MVSLTVSFRCKFSRLAFYLAASANHQVSNLKYYRSAVINRTITFSSRNKQIQSLSLDDVVPYLENYNYNLKFVNICPEMMVLVANMTLFLRKH